MSWKDTFEEKWNINSDWVNKEDTEHSQDFCVFEKEKIKSFIQSTIDEEVKKAKNKIHDDWEVGIRFSENDEEGTILDRKVMDNHLRMSKEETK